MVNLYIAAENEVKNRRLAAENELLRRRALIHIKIPEIRELEQRITQTNTELIKLIINNKDLNELERIRKQNQQAQEMTEDLLAEKGYPRDFLNADYTCPKCEDSGYLNGERCVCFMNTLKRLAVENLNKTANMPDCDFEHFSLDFYKGVKSKSGDCYAVMSGILDYCKAYADDFGLYSDNLLFYGNTGLGKTHLSLAIAKTAAEKGYNAAYGSLLNFLHTIEKEHFGRAEYDADTLQTLLNTDLLVLDDLGSEFQTSFYESVIYNLINTRLNLALPTIISTNLTKDEMQQRYNDRIISRIFGGYQSFCFAGKDIRQIKRINENI